MGQKLKQSQGPLASLLPDKEKASILVITLWTLCLLSFFSVTLSYGVRQKLFVIKRLDERDRLYYIADAAVKKAIMQIAKEGRNDCDALKDGWSNDDAAFRDVSIGGGNFSVSYNYRDEASGGMRLRYGLIDEESKININTADRKVLERFFMILLNCSDIDAQELAASIIDWRDADSLLSIPLGSAEDSYYKGQSYPYEAKDSSLESLDELLLVKGMDEGILNKIRNYATVYGEGRINVNTASRVVLSALGLSEKIINDIVLFRAGEDGITGSPDDNVFEQAASIAEKLNQRYQLGEAESAQLGAISQRYLGTRSHIFTVSATAQLNNRKTSAHVVSIINRQGKIFYWSES